MHNSIYRLFHIEMHFSFLWLDVTEFSFFLSVLDFHQAVYCR